MRRWSAGTARSFRRPAHERHEHAAAAVGAGAAAGVQAERGTVRAAAARGGVLLRHAPHRGRVRAYLDPARVHDHRSHAVRVQRVRRRPGRLAGVAALYIQTALQATWGGPPLWPVFVGAAGVTVVTVIGFTCGVLFPGRFTAPLVAIGVLVLEQTGLRQALGVTASSGTYALLSPANAPLVVDAGVYHHVAPDLSIVQVMFMGGIAIALFGALGVAPELRQLASARGVASARAALARSGGWLPRAVAVTLVACGVAASWTAFALAGTAKPDPVGGWEIPALHSAASDQPVPATQDCTSSSGFQVCVHPAFSLYLHDVAAALDPVAAEIAGLPGAPAGAKEVASVSGGQDIQSGTAANPPVFEFTAEHVGAMLGQFNGIPDPAAWTHGFQQGLLDAFLTGR